MVSSVMLAISSNTFWVMLSRDARGMNAIMKSVATRPSAKAIGMPENRISSVAPP